MFESQTNIKTKMLCNIVNYFLKHDGRGKCIFSSKFYITADVYRYLFNNHRYTCILYTPMVIKEVSVDISKFYCYVKFRRKKLYTCSVFYKDIMHSTISMCHFMNRNRNSFSVWKSRPNDNTTSRIFSHEAQENISN